MDRTLGQISTLTCTLPMLAFIPIRLWRNWLSCPFEKTEFPKETFTALWYLSQYWHFLFLWVRCLPITQRSEMGVNPLCVNNDYAETYTEKYQRIGGELINYQWISWCKCGFSSVPLVFSCFYRPKAFATSLNFCHAYKGAFKPYIQADKRGEKWRIMLWVSITLGIINGTVWGLIEKVAVKYKSSNSSCKSNMEPILMFTQRM